jgi:hypothetical protein
MDDQVYKAALDAILCLVKLSMVEGYADDDQLLSFRVDSSPGLVSDDPNSDLNCAREPTKKEKILELARNKKFREKPVILCGVRTQLEKVGKIRPATYFNEHHEVVDGFVTPNNGQRVRLVNGFSWVENAWLMGINKTINSGLHPLLKSLWKQTNVDIDNLATSLGNPYTFCADVSNNDYFFPYEANKYVHQQILPDWLYDAWLNVYENGYIYGVYVDDESKKRYYRIALSPNDNHKPLFSGEGLTSIMNKIIHTANQLRCRFLMAGGEPAQASVESMMRVLVDHHEYILNNGDDYADFFKTPEDRDKYAQIVMATDWIDIGEEDPGFSGIAFVIDRSGRFSGVQPKFSSLFEKTLETERRDTTSVLASLPYNSVVGKLRFFETLNKRDDDIIAQAEDLFLDLVGLPTISREELEKLAKMELAELDPTKDRGVCIAKILDKLGEIDPNVLHWKYTLEEIAEIAPECVEDMFITTPLWDFLDLDFYLELTDSMELALPEGSVLRELVS